MPHHPSLASSLFYVDPRAAIDFLRAAFGFELDLLLEDESGNVAHSQLSWGDGQIMVGGEWSEKHKSPTSIGMICTQSVYMRMRSGIDAHCETARKAGAEILQEPETQFYGDRTYRARDLEGHIWTFSQTVREMTPSEWDEASGLKTVVARQR